MVVVVVLWLCTDWNEGLFLYDEWRMDDVLACRGSRLASSTPVLVNMVKSCFVLCFGLDQCASSM